MDERFEGRLMIDQGSDDVTVAGVGVSIANDDIAREKVTSDH